MKAFKKPIAYFSVISIALILVLCLAVSKTGAFAIYSGGTVRKTPIYSVERSDNKISISFDCAYGADYTYKILDALDEYGVKCTFFCVEFWVNKYPEVAQEIVKRGHEIGTHSKTHPKMSKLNKAQIEEELSSSVKAIEDLTGQKVELFRAPFGDYDNELLEVATAYNLFTIQWDVDSIDWKDISAKEITNRVLSKTKSGSIILCHNNALHTHEALPYILSNLKEKGYEFVKISELIYKENYKINSFGVQVKNEQS